MLIPNNNVKDITANPERDDKQFVVFSQVRYLSSSNNSFGLVNNQQIGPSQGPIALLAFL